MARKDWLEVPCGICDSEHICTRLVVDAANERPNVGFSIRHLDAKPGEEQVSVACFVSPANVRELIKFLQQLV